MTRRCLQKIFWIQSHARYMLVLAPNIIIIIIPHQQHMKAKKIQPKIEIDNQEGDPCRRSLRKKPEQKVDYYQMSQGKNEDYGDYYDEEDYEPRQMRKRRKCSEDFEGKVPKKKNLNRIVGLLDWKREVEVPPFPEEGTYKVETVKKICKSDPSKFGTGIEGLLINIKWAETNGSKKGDGVTIKQFAELNLESTNLISNGIVFIWIEKSVLGQIIEIMEHKGFMYVENFQIVFLDLDKGNAELSKLCNIGKQKEKEERSSSKGKGVSKKKSKLDTASEDTVIYNEEIEFAQKEVFLSNMDKLMHLDPSDIFLYGSSHPLRKSKAELMLFRKFPKNKKSQNLELRHQRNPDVIFDIVSPKTMAIDRITKSFVYNMIETLLPLSLSKPFKLMELWGNKDAPRNGWITVAEK